MFLEQYTIQSNDSAKELTIKQIRELNLVVDEVAANLNITANDVIKQYLNIVNKTGSTALKTNFLSSQTNFITIY